MIERLRAWVHYKKLEPNLSEDDALLVSDVEAVIADNEELLKENQQLKDGEES